MFRNETSCPTNPVSGRFTPRKWIVFLAAFAVVYLSAGVAVDYGKAYAAESDLRAAAEETASILAIKAERTPLWRLQVEAENRLESQLAMTGDSSAIVSVTVVGRSVRVSASARMATIFLNIMRKPRLGIAATATAIPAKARSLFAFRRSCILSA